MNLLNTKNVKSIVGVSDVDSSYYQRTRFGFKEVKNGNISGYEVVVSYNGNVSKNFRNGQNVKHGARIVKSLYDAKKQTTDVTYFFDNGDSLNREDSYQAAQKFQTLYKQQIKTK